MRPLTTRKGDFSVINNEFRGAGARFRVGGIGSARKVHFDHVFGAVLGHGEETRVLVVGAPSPLDHMKDHTVARLVGHVRRPTKHDTCPWNIWYKNRFKNDDDDDDDDDDYDYDDDDDDDDDVKY